MDSNPPSPAKVSERNLGGQATQQGKIIFSKTYDPKKVEDKIYTLWQKSGYFNPDKLPRRHKKPYCVIIPPPNVTGTLHMGHALNATIQDILIRWRRLQGYKTLWLPGTDHAGIATQVVVEKELKKEGRNRFDLGREKFIERIWQWKEKYGDIISDQLKKLGASCDWSRTRFTMDEDYIKATEQAFSHYYKKGLIYQGEKTVNWCPRCQTSLSDLELIYQEEPAEFYYIKYGPLTIATVRPETKLGDTAVAVNPKDSRYKNYIGKIIEIKTVLGPAKMKVIGDESVDINFGTGAMKVTPAHDIHDFELAEKHGLEKKQVIGPDGRMTKLAGKYAGLTVMEARKQIVEDMKKIGILEKV
ncbi:class I tRNA ligase family protein, partial [bacterium]|nr:class I tRNA ligase family protein [bacterium]